MMQSLALGLLCALPCAAAAATAAFTAPDIERLGADGQTDVQLTLERSHGRFGQADTTRMLSLPLVWRHQRGRFTAQVEVPLLRVESPVTLVPGIGAAANAAPRARQVEQGLGDIWLKGSFELVPFEHAQTGWDLTLKVKTRSGHVNRGLGTGGTDLAAQVEFFRALGPATVFGHAGYRRMGQPAGALPYRNPWYGEVGAFTAVGTGCSAGGYHTARQAIGRLGALSETTLYGACTEGRWRTQLALTRGFKPASADWALGLTVRYRFGG